MSADEVLQRNNDVSAYVSTQVFYDIRHLFTVVIVSRVVDSRFAMSLLHWKGNQMKSITNNNSAKET